MSSFSKICSLVAISLWSFVAYSQDGSGIQNLGPTINSNEVEYAPSISADGNTMIYQSSKEGNYELHMAHRDQNGIWSQSEVIESIRNFGNDDILIAGSSLSYDGNYIYFFASYPGTYGIEDIWYLEKEGYSWSNPKNAGPNINSEGYEGFPSISADGSKIYFMRSIKSSYKGKFCYQLYLSEKDDEGQWTPAQPLPSPISQGCENCPRIMSDNETLVFAAIRGDSDNYDIYQSRQQADGAWSEPVALDFINTDIDDLYGTIPSSGEVMYFNRNLGSSHDIYQIPIPKDLQPKKVVNIQGVVKDADSNLPMEVQIDVVKDGVSMGTSGLKSNAYDGNFTIVLKTGSLYNLKISPENYVPQTLIYDLREKDEYDLITRDIILEKFKIKQHFYTLIGNDTIVANIYVNDRLIDSEKGYFTVKADSSYAIRIEKEGIKTVKKTIKIDHNITVNDLYETFELIPEKLKFELGDKLAFNSISFETSSAELTDDDKIELNNVIKVIARNNILVEISAHTDDVGSAASNMKLSEARAIAVLKYFTDQKIPERMLITKGYGESQPIAPNNSDENRRKNRRVEFIVKEIK